MPLYVCPHCGKKSYEGGGRPICCHCGKLAPKVGRSPHKARKKK